jgi:hypothetical protein
MVVQRVDDLPDGELHDQAEPERDERTERPSVTRRWNVK